MSHSAWDDGPAHFETRTNVVFGKIGRFFAWLFAIAAITLGTAYYLPLYRAHRALTARVVSLEGQRDTLERSLSAARSDLAAASTERDALKQKSDAAQAKSVSDAGHFGAAVSGAKTSMKRFIDGNVLTIDGKGAVAVVSFMPAGLAGIEAAPDVTVARRLALCEVMRALPPTRVDVVAYPDATAPNTTADQWDAPLLRGRRIAEALEGVCKVSPDVTSVTVRARPSAELANVALSITLPAVP